MSTEMRAPETNGPETGGPETGGPETGGLETGGLRERAVKRLKKKSDFHVHLLIYVTVNAFLVAVWAMTGAGFFWPVFPIAGWGIGVVANAWDAYARDVPTESQIRHEMDKLAER